MYFYADMLREYPYRFVYDDSDNSVELVDIRYLDRELLNIQQLSYEKLHDNDKYLSHARLKVLGFEEFSIGLKDLGFIKRLCRYQCDSLNLILEVVACDYKDSFNSYSVKAMCKTGNLRIKKNGSSVLGTPKFVEKYNRIFSKSDTSISINIPYIMMQYLMNLYSSHDFEGLMRSVDGFLGKNFHIVSGISVQHMEVNFGSWL